MKNLILNEHLLSTFETFDLNIYLIFDYVPIIVIKTTIKHKILYTYA
jgi:hypothetical protein